MGNFFKTGDVTIQWFGHASFKIKTSDVVMYIDPYAGTIGNYSEKADLVLVSHEHYDHCDSTKINAAKDENTKIIASKNAAIKLANLDPDITTMLPGETATVKGIEISTIPAYNISKNFHPKNALGVGFIFTVSGVRIYFAGDTDLTPEMRNLATQNIDIALLPIGGTYTMDGNEAGEAANAIKAKIVIPMHYGSLPGLEMNAEKFMERTGDSIRVIILKLE